MAQLMVRVDAGAGAGPVWLRVRRHGLPAAREILEGPWHRALVALHKGRAISFAAVTEPLENEVEITRVMTDPHFTRRGLARRLVTDLIASCDAEGYHTHLHALEISAAAIVLYESLGFVTTGHELDSYSGRPARQMRRNAPRQITFHQLGTYSRAHDGGAG